MSAENQFWIQYQIEASDLSGAESKAEMIAVEQSVEMPPEVVPESARKNIGSVREVVQETSGTWRAKIDFQSALFDGDITQFLNILFGNISLQTWCKLVDAETAVFNKTFCGPSFGITGIRNSLGITDRPLSCAVIKPIGASSVELSEMARHFAAGGIDIIKDDHGLTDQNSARFKERIKNCAQSVRKGEQISGKKSLYFPNITVSPLKIKDHFELAVELGADGVLIAPQLVGFETIHELAQMDTLPIMAHPTFSGSYLINKSGIDPVFYFGKLNRALGADAVIYPNAHGRFSFTNDLCKSINRACRKEFGTLRPAFPSPGGGVRLETISDLVSSYGTDTIFLIGGSLFKQGNQRNAAQQFQQALRTNDK